MEEIKEILEVHQPPQSISDTQSWIGGEIGIILVAALSMAAKYWLLKSPKIENSEKDIQIAKLEAKLIEAQAEIKILQRAIDLSGDFAPPVSKKRVEELEARNDQYSTSNS